MPGGTTTPFEVISSWPARSDNPVRRGWGLTVFTALAYILSITILALRLWARHIIQRNAGLDDMVILFAVIPMTGLAILIAGGGRWWFFDRHVWDLTAEQGVLTRKLAMAIELMYLFSTALIKISILLFYRRIVRSSYSPAFLWAVRGCIGFVTCYTAAFTFTLFLGCRPLPAFWKKVDFVWVMAHPEGKEWQCFNEAANVIAATVLSVVQDFIACLMPTIIFWKLSLPFRQKAALSVIFGMGIFTCVAGIVRLYYIYQIFYASYDTTWIAYSTWFWTSIEIHLGIVCASLPALKIYFQNNVKPAQLRVYLDSWRGDETFISRLETGKKVPVNTVISEVGGRRQSSTSRNDRSSSPYRALDLGRAGIHVTGESDTTDRFDLDQKEFHTEIDPSPPMSPTSPSLRRQSTSGSKRPLRIHDASEEIRPGSYAASELFNEKRLLEIHGSTVDRMQSLASSEAPEHHRPLSSPATGVMDGVSPKSRKASTLDKRSSTG